MEAIVVAAAIIAASCYVWGVALDVRKRKDKHFQQMMDALVDEAPEDAHVKR